MTKKWIYEFLAVVAISIFLTVALTYPAAFSLTTKIIGDKGDNIQFLGFQYLGKLLFSQGSFPFGWTNYWRYPEGINFD